MSRGCNVNVKTKLGRSALSKSCWNGRIDVVEELLKNPLLDVNVQDKNNRSPLHNSVWGAFGGYLG